MTRVSTWVGAGVFTAGMSAALLAGAGAAHADEGGSSKSDRSDKQSAATKSDSARGSDHRRTRAAKQRPKSTVSGGVTARVAASARSEKPDREPRRGADLDRADATTGPSAATDAVTRKARSTIRGRIGEVRRTVRAAVETVGAEPEVRVRPPRAVRSALAESQVAPDPAEADQAPTPRDIRIKTTLRQALAAGPAENDPVEGIHDVLRTIGGLVLNPEPQNYPAPVSFIGDVLFDTLASLERIAGGEPMVPPELRDQVEVSSSTLVVSEGHEVESNWYFPNTEEGQPAPTRMIYLQHGFLANGPIYSYTASYLAAQTNSVVVTTTYTSNPFEADGMWLGGDNLHEAVAQLFLDPDRTALNASMETAELKAGRVENIDVPLQFVLVGHSLGGGFAPGVAGYYAEGLVRRRDAGEAAPNELAGVVAYDAVPMGTIVPDAMDRLDTLEGYDDDPADYIPIYEIGAPLNYLNVFSDVNAQLTEARPGQFTGVVLEDGVHMDPMQGANPVIQAAAYLIAGFPQPQNPLAVRELSAGWINDMFDEKIDPATGACGLDCAGQYGDGDDSFVISTPHGDAVAVMIGSQRAEDMTSLRAISVTDFITALPANIFNGLVTTCDVFTGGKCRV